PSSSARPPPRLAQISSRAVSDPLATAVLVSGAVQHLQALLERVHGREAEIVAVASSVDDAPALARASARGIPVAVFARTKFPERGARDEALADWLAERGVKLVVLAGYMELLTPAFLARY